MPVRGQHRGGSALTTPRKQPPRPPRRRRSRSQRRERGSTDSHAPDAPRSSDPLLTGKDPSTDEWVAAVRTKQSKIEVVPGQTARKVSNLPA